MRRNRNARQSDLFAWLGQFGVVGPTFFRPDHVAGPETVGHAPRRRAIHHQIAESRARIARVANRDRVADAAGPARENYRQARRRAAHR